MKIPNPTTEPTLYEADFAEWIEQTTRCLRQGKFSELDIENLIEEVESLGRSEKNALKSNLRVLLMHLLKWQYQPHRRSRSWQGTIVEHRHRLHDLLKDSPSLKNTLTEVMPQTYSQAVKQAALETGISAGAFPAQCCYSVEQILNVDFFPGSQP